MARIWAAGSCRGSDAMHDELNIFVDFTRGSARHGRGTLDTKSPARGGQARSESLEEVGVEREALMLYVSEGHAGEEGLWFCGWLVGLVVDEMGKKIPGPS
jgi:hypothetical protein